MYNQVTVENILSWASGSLQDPSVALDAPVTGVSVDTRRLQPGNFFVALKGTQTDGHQFCEEAVQKGAACILVQEAITLTQNSTPVIQVPDTLRALVAIAATLRDRFVGKVFAITGSAGKSSTKDMLAVLMGENTVSSPASFNNLLGVSQTLCLVTDDTRNLVLEMGMNASGEILEMCRHFRPQGGLITNIGDAHIGKLGSRERVFHAKRELFDYLATTRGADFMGIAFNMDDPLVVRACGDAFGKKEPNRTFYSLKRPTADVFVESPILDPETAQLSMQLHIRGTAYPVKLPLFGAHHAQNIAAAVAGAFVMGQTKEGVLGNLGKVRPAKHRGEIWNLDDGSTLIDESYNSNPTALTASLESFAALSNKRRRILVVGEMRELGEFTEPLHKGVAQKWLQLSAASGISYSLVTVGEEGAKAFSDVLKAHDSNAKIEHVPDAQSASAWVSAERKPGDFLFVKGSRGVQLDKVVADILTRQPIKN